MIKETLRGAGKDVTYGFIDGSCKGNPVTCGARACLFFPNQEKYPNQCPKDFQFF